MDWGIVVIIGIFLFYYILILIDRKKFITDPKEIITKFLGVVLLYAGISLIYLSITGVALFQANPETYNVYIFIMGFIAILWTIPFLIKEFRFYNRWFVKGDEHEDLKLKKKKK
jgi:hypothetical protein